MSQSNNSALPLNSYRDDSTLPIVFNQTTFGIPLGQVHCVNYPKTLTLLPFNTAQVDGLISFNGQPIVQLNVARTLGTENQSVGKIIVIALPQGNIALRVDEVLSFMSTIQGESSEINRNDQNLPLLKLDELFPWIKHAKKVTSQKSTEKNISEMVLNHHILLVSSADKTIAILANSIERIEQIDESLSPRKIDGQADFVARIENNLFPARSLAHLLGAKSCSEKQALIIQDGNNTSVLAVERIFNLEKVNHLHLTTHSEKQSLWHLNDNGEIIEVVDAKEFFGKIAKYQGIKIADTQLRWNNMPQLVTQLSAEGVRIYCGQMTCVLPLSLVSRIIGDLSDLNHKIESSKSLKPEIEGTKKIPIINCVKLLNPLENSQATNYILLSIPDGRVIVGVSRAVLQPMLPPEKWSPLTLLPPDSALFFDAATFDETEKKWVLRVKTDIDFSKFPWHIKRLIATALTGWIEPKILEIDQD